jgi:hypothetical protein
MIAGDLFLRLQEQGIELVFDGQTLRCRSEAPLDPRLVAELKQYRQQLIATLEVKQSKARAWLDDSGRLRMNGPVPAGCTMLEVLVSLDATMIEIERHIHPIGSPRQWQQWARQSPDNE